MKKREINIFLSFFLMLSLSVGSNEKNFKIRKSVESLLQKVAFVQS